MNTETEHASYWWSNEVEVTHVEGMLTRAGVLSESERQYFREKPWKWSSERRIAGRLESVFAECGIPAHEAWEMTGAQMLRAMQARMSR